MEKEETKNADSVLDTGRAIKFFWSRMVKAQEEEEERRVREYKELCEKVQRVADKIDAVDQHQTGLLRGLWNAMWHGRGVTKAEGDKLFK